MLMVSEVPSWVTRHGFHSSERLQLQCTVTRAPRAMSAFRRPIMPCSCIFAALGSNVADASLVSGLGGSQGS
ncbi:hypothetical protein BJY01DRAFT_205926 [Aspergillus pseudoustus]|uniref:Uncharacterized protein n=1 Tax=Aspergillus pseudoustus TaxID=1810923 RepID=A0ABR4KNK2_9EURO